MNETVKRTITASILLIVGAVLWFFFPPYVISLLLGVTLGYILLVEWPPLNPFRGRLVPACLFTLVYPVLPFCLLIAFNQCMGDIGRHFLLFLCFITFAHDTGAYIFGKLYGRHKIMPSVSPHKSWEGFFGGYACSLIVAFLFVYRAYVTINVLGLPLYVLLLNIAGLAGDMFESYLKRRAGVKDSGTLLPGHGGLLDRFDSILFAATAFFIVILL